ncbi:MAG TPA: endonuclease MutS2 [Chlorobaculum sp.]|uniref:Endonuclease MutS2 n=1 Tax=Chlorobaculum tepidum (strain ATCC 49652 / DSM 12025 / NBRC 103806 / TLS) TaxID=194439 RepID=Q8KFJ2_CHLTE|nr:DNA mismatch binding protein MutS2 [Chlorobaculum tepidum TLS]HBU23807.1 endonuclease MutS2 [Chlorobaculum sp.]
MDETTVTESVSLFRKLEFDKVARHAAGFCISAMGSDLLMEMGLPDECERELVRVLELKNFLLEGEPLPFSRLPDTRFLLSKLEVLDSWLNAAELLDIFYLLQSSAQLRKFMFTSRERFPALNEFTIRIWLEKSIQYSISQAIDERAVVRDTASDALYEIRKKLGEARDGLRRKMERILRRCQNEGWLMEETVALKNGRQVLPLRVENKHRLPGYIQDYSQTGQTVFVEPAETLEISNRIQELEIAERREIERILKALSDGVRQELENVRHNERIMAAFDSLYARARLAVETGSMLPKISAGRRLKIVKGYHPWLFISHGFSKEKVFPLDMELDENEQVLVISGPNAGGKSVAMKTVGLLVCMLRHGYLVPCSESSEFPLFNSIFIEIGDEQSIENDLSTFSSHLSAIRDILDHAQPDSLVLIDELCSGTDVEEGSAIARAVIEELLERGVKTIVTTHLGELKLYAHRREGVVNGAMEFDRHGLAPTFRFLKGVPGNSFAFAMMRRMGFSDEIVNRATGFLTTGHTGLEEMIEDFRKSAASNRELERELRRERLEAESIRSALTLQRAELRKKMQELKSRGYRDLDRQLEQARKEIRDLVREVKEHPGDDATLHKARTKLAGMKRELAVKGEQVEREVAPQADLSIRPGDTVRIGDTNTTGEVESIQGDSAVVQCGNFRLTTALRGLKKISRAGAKKLQKEAATGAAAGKSWSVKSSTLESTRLDLRGLTGDEAIAEIGRFIDALAVHRMPFGTIVHGKGSGALRLRTAEFLKQHSRVKSFRLGDWQEGGAGVTVVEMR